MRENAYPVSIHFSLASTLKRSETQTFENAVKMPRSLKTELSYFLVKTLKRKAFESFDNADAGNATNFAGAFNINLNREI